MDSFVAELQKIISEYQKRMWVIDEANEEIERLREALREITTPAYEYLSDEAAARHKIEIARAALGEKE